MKNNSSVPDPVCSLEQSGTSDRTQNRGSLSVSFYVLEMLDIHEGTMVRYHQGYLTGQIGDKQQYLDDMKL